MESKRIGECIAALRQGAGRTQEELAQAVGVSAQAVSKWECGGMPDAALLPGIADFLGVPIDRIYGREGTGGDIYEALRRRFAGMDHTQRMQEAMSICFDLQKVLVSRKYYCLHKTRNCGILKEKGGIPKCRGRSTK